MSDHPTGVEKYEARARNANSLVCVGLDTSLERVPERFKAMEYPQFEFNKWIVEETHAHVAAYKPNIAFYEARGEAGYKELKLTLDHLRERHPDIFLICDAKRGEIGSTMAAYAESLFDHFGFDAVTVNPYLGGEPLAPFLERKDKISIILARTSNPGAGEFQDLVAGGKPLWQIVAEHVKTWNKNGNCMIVAGATYPEEMRSLRELMGGMTFLVPGVGAQGGPVRDAVTAGLNSQKLGLIINSSRGIIWSEDPGTETRKLQTEINSYR